MDTGSNTNLEWEGLINTILWCFVQFLDDGAVVRAAAAVVSADLFVLGFGGSAAVVLTSLAGGAWPWICC